MDKIATSLIDALLAGNPILIIVVIGFAFWAPILGCWLYLERKERLRNEDRHVKNAEANREVFDKFSEQQRALKHMLETFMGRLP